MFADIYEIGCHCIQYVIIDIGNHSLSINLYTIYLSCYFIESIRYFFFFIGFSPNVFIKYLYNIMKIIRFGVK